MIWVGWRQQRTETLIAAAFLVVLAVALLPSGLHMASAYHRDGLAACAGDDTSFSCADAVASFVSRFGQLAGLIAWLTLLPGLIGVLLAAPFVHPFETGAYRLDWTQSVTPRRWIATKLGLALAAAVVASLALTTFITWWRTPLVHLQGRMDNSVFDSEGTVVVGYTLFALGLALALGVLLRRAVPALIVAFGGYFAARLFVDLWLRQQLSPPLAATWRARGPEPPGLGHAWIINEYPSDRLGHVAHPPLGPCLRAANGVKACLADNAPSYLHAVYEPAARFWTMQAVETALFAGVAIALLAFAAWWTERRAA